MKIEITGRNFEVDEKIRAYAEEKIGCLEKYMAASNQDGVRAEIVLEDDPSGREDNHCVCDCVLVAPGGKLVAREGTVNMFAAIDIVEAKLQAQLVKRKEKHMDAPRRGGLLGKIINRSAGEPTAEETEEAEV